MQARQTRALAKAAPEQDDDETPRDIDAIRDELAQRINQLLSTAEKRWRTCRERCCKRARACRAPKGSCANAELSTRPVKPAQVARTMAQVQRMLRERIEQQDAEAEAHQSGDRIHQKS